MATHSSILACKKNPIDRGASPAPLAVPSAYTVSAKVSVDNLTVFPCMLFVAFSVFSL